jgi:hypothetical protein
MRSPLETLTHDQKDQLYDWLLEMPVPKVAEKIALPAPDGFGIKTHITTLQRFKQRHWAEHTANQIEAAVELASSTSGHPTHDTTLDNGIASALKRHFFERASDPNATDDQLALVARWFHRNEKHKLDVQRVQIARERLAQNNRRLDLHERAVKVREDALALRREERLPKPNPPKRKEDALGPLIRRPEDIEARADRKFGLRPPVTPTALPGSAECHSAVSPIANRLPSNQPVTPITNH